MKWCYECENYTKSFWIVRRNSEKVYCQICGTMLSNSTEREIKKMPSRNTVNSFWLFVVVGLFIFAATFGGR